MDLKDFCIDGGNHNWFLTGRSRCDCSDSLCCLECSHCDEIDCYCEDY